MERIAIETVVFNHIVGLLAEKPSFIDAVLWYREYETMSSEAYQPSLLFCKKVIDAVRFHRFQIPLYSDVVYVDLGGKS